MRADRLQAKEQRRPEQCVCRTEREGGVVVVVVQGKRAGARAFSASKWSPALLASEPAGGAHVAPQDVRNEVGASGECRVPPTTMPRSP